MVSNLLLGYSGKEFEAMVSSVNLKIVKVYGKINNIVVFFKPGNKIVDYNSTHEFIYVCLQIVLICQTDSQMNNISLGNVQSKD